MADRVSEIRNQSGESMAIKTREPRGYTRRGVFLATGAVIATGLAASTQMDKVAGAISEFFSKKPTEVYLGEVEVDLKEINLRDEARRKNPNYGNFDLRKIKKINGKIYGGERILFLENVLIAEGTNPDNPNDVGTGRWAKIRLEYEDSGEVDAYFSISEKTKPVMILKPKEGYAKITEAKDGEVKLEGLPPLTKDQVNVTSFKQSFTPSNK